MFYSPIAFPYSSFGFYDTFSPFYSSFLTPFVAPVVAPVVTPVVAPIVPAPVYPKYDFWELGKIFFYYLMTK